MNANLKIEFEGSDRLTTPHSRAVVYLGLKSELPLREAALSALLLARLPGFLVRGESPTLGTRPLEAKVERNSLFVTVELDQILALHL